MIAAVALMCNGHVGKRSRLRCWPGSGWNTWKSMRSIKPGLIQTWILCHIAMIVDFISSSFLIWLSLFGARTSLCLRRISLLAFHTNADEARCAWPRAVLFKRGSLYRRTIADWLHSFHSYDAVVDNVTATCHASWRTECITVRESAVFRCHASLRCFLQTWEELFVAWRVQLIPIDYYTSTVSLHGAINEASYTCLLAYMSTERASSGSCTEVVSCENLYKHSGRLSKQRYIALGNWFVMTQ